MSNQPPSGPPEDWGQGNDPSEPPPPPPGQGWGQPPQGQPEQGQPWGQPGGEQGGPGQPPYQQGPGQPPQPWGQPGDYGSPPPSGSGKRNLLPFIVAGAAIVLVAVVLLVVLVANSGGGGGSPQATAEDFVAAAKAGDCEKALSLITDNLKEKGDASCADGSNLLPPDDASIEFGDVKVTDESDDTATAVVDVTFSGQSVPLTMRLVKQDEDWLIDEIGS